MEIDTLGTRLIMTIDTQSIMISFSSIIRYRVVFTRFFTSTIGGSLQSNPSNVSLRPPTLYNKYGLVFQNKNS